MTEDSDNNHSYWDPILYNANSEPQLKWSIAMLEKYQFKGNESVLDVGCGNGRVTALIASKVKNGEVIGIDLSQDMVHFANQAYNDLPNVFFQQGNAADFNLPYQFDLITCFNVLHWIYQQEQALTCIYHHLKPQGTALLHLGRPIRDQGIVEGLAYAIDEPRFSQYFVDFVEGPYMSYMTMEDYQWILEHIGFQVLECQEKEIITELESHEKFALWVQAVLVHGSRLPSELRTPFFLAVTEKYAEVTQQPNQQIRYSYFAWEIKATKK